MEAIKKLNTARQEIKKSKLKKLGFNSYSEYHYFTPEQISELTNNPDFGLFNKFDLVRTEYGLMAKLSVIDLESGKSVDFQIATDIPVIKATNIAQQLGGAVTYSERYLLQVAYDIKDNNLDLDTTKQTKSNVAKPTKTKILPGSEKWIKAIEFLKGGGTIQKIKDSYVITEEHVQQLIIESE